MIFKKKIFIYMNDLHYRTLCFNISKAEAVDRVKIAV